MPVSIIQKRLNSIPPTTGIYQFFDDKTQLLYVGKAKNLHKRVSSYTKENLLSPRIARMVLLTKKIEIIQTENEVEALLLEHNLIKKFQPKFNILLRDDKTFPQILITNHNFPQITKFRSLRLDNIEAQSTKHETCISDHSLQPMMSITPSIFYAKFSACAIVPMPNSNRAKNHVWNIK